jgi:serine protease Do
MPDIVTQRDSHSVDGTPGSQSSHSASPAARNRRESSKSVVVIPWWAIVWTFALLLALPWFLEQIQYALVRGRERAEADTAREQLREVRMDDVSRVFRLVAQSTSPSVVHIRSRRKTQPIVQASEDAADRSEDYLPQGEGSGVVMDPSGLILTNYHVIEDSDTIDVRLGDGREVKAHLVGEDEHTDLAVLRVSAGKLMPAIWGQSTELKVGDFVWAIGSPFGLDRSITFGIVSAKGRRGMLERGFQNFLQTDAAVNPGNSGGPLVDSQGRVVGINTAIVGTSFQGVSFAIPSEVARRVYEQIVSGEAVQFGFLGVEPIDLTGILREKLKLKDEDLGAYIQRVVPRNPAADAGLRVDDVIVEWNGRPITGENDLRLAVVATHVGEGAVVRYIREGRVQEAVVNVGFRGD